LSGRELVEEMLDEAEETDELEELEEFEVIFFISGPHNDLADEEPKKVRKIS
jgi:hypothetical protein